MKKIRLTLLMLMAFLMPLVMFGQNTVTVNDGTATNNYVPVYGLYTDTQGSTSEFIIPSTAEGMDLLTNGTISNLTFYLSSPASGAWTATMQVYMAEVESTTLSAVVGPDACTVVYTGTLDATGTTMEITLDQPYTYQGGNLLIGTYVQVEGNYKAASFYGVSAASGAGYHMHESTTSAQSFMAKTTFTYTGGSVITCPKPTDIVCAAYTATTATLAWTAGGEETSWILEYSTNEDFTGATSTTVTGTPTTELTGLTAETTYYVRVKAVCTVGTDESDWSNAATFMPSTLVKLTVHDGTTTNSYVPMYCGYFDDFTKSQFVIPATDLEDMVGGTISSIKYYTTSQNMPYTTVSSVDIFVMEVDNTSLSEYADKANGQLVHSGTVDFVSEGAGGACVITFSTPYVYNGGNLLIGSENTTDAGYKFIYFYGETVEDASIAASDGTSLENVTTATQRNFIPKTTFTYLPGEGPSCAKPANMEVSNLTATSATITWTNPNEDAIAGYVLMLNDEEITGITAADLTYTFTDLTPNTPYVVKLRTVCTESDSSIWNTITFTTECPAFVVTSENPFHEGFEGATVACWSLEQDEEADSWWVSEGENAYEGTHYAAAPFTPGNVTRLISPVLDLTQIANPVLSYQHFQAYYQNAYLDVLTVYYRTSETSEWVLLADFADSSYTYYVQETHELPEASATYQISFLATSNDGYNILLDDINITGEAIVEPCAVPTNVTVENNVVTWEGNAASYNVMVVVGEDTTTANVTATTYTIEGLEDGTEGTVAVQAVCAEDNISEWSEPVAFTFVGVGINNYGIQANIYPNPTTGNVTVESNAINADITVFDMFGKLMMTSKVAAERTELNFSTFAPGVYMIRIANNNGTTTVKVVKE